MLRLLAALVLCTLWNPPLALAREPIKVGAIGYPSIDAAFTDLQKKKNIAQHFSAAWIIIDIKGTDDRRRKTAWWFTRPSHPAHPAVFRRVRTTRDGIDSMKMDLICEGEKLACELMITQFDKSNRRIESITANRAPHRPKPPASLPKWRPTQDYLRRAVILTEGFLATLDSGKLQEAYKLFGPALKAKMSYDDFVRYRQRIGELSGGPIVRTDKRITWYKDPPGALQPGVYAAVNIVCKIPGQSYCAEVVVLHEPPGGTFGIIQQQTDLIDPVTLMQLQNRSR